VTIVVGTRDQADPIEKLAEHQRSRRAGELAACPRRDSMAAQNYSTARSPLLRLRRLSVISADPLSDARYRGAVVAASGAALEN
jgi:hypothetical protein